MALSDGCTEINCSQINNGGLKEIRFHSLSDTEKKEWEQKLELGKRDKTIESLKREIESLKVEIWKQKAKRRKWQIRAMKYQEM